VSDPRVGEQPPHLGADDLRRLVEQAVPREVAHGWVFHLLFCPECRARLADGFPARGIALLARLRRFPVLQAQKTSAAAAPPVKWQRLSGAATRSLLSEYRLCYQEEDEAPPLYRELIRHPLPRQEMLLENSPRYRTLGLLKYVLSRTPEQWHRDPEAAESHARLALAIHRRLATDRYPSRLVSDFGARAWAYLANALRIRGDLPTADRAMDRASQELERGTGDAADRARLMQLRVSLRRDQRRLEDASADALMATRLWRSVGERRAETEAVLLLSSALFEAGNTFQAIELIRKCLQGSTELEVGARLYFLLLQNLARMLAQTDRPAEASRYVPELRELAASLGEPISMFRVDWLEALIDAGLGRTPLAAIRFQRLLERFLDFQMSYDAALVGLDLAAVYLEAGDTAAARELAGKLVPIFNSLQIEREATEALLLFVEALRKEAATVAMAEKVKGMLRR